MPNNPCRPLCSKVLCPPDGACQADATMRGGLLTGHATFDGFQHIVADILFGLGALIGDTGSFRESDGARHTDAAIRGGLATRHAAFDGFQHFVASIVTEFM